MSSIIKCGPSPSKLAFWVDWKMADIISPLPGCSKRKSGKSISVEEQQIILNVTKYFQEESKSGNKPQFRAGAVIAKTAAATGVSKDSVRKIVSAGKVILLMKEKLVKQRYDLESWITLMVSSEESFIICIGRIFLPVLSLKKILLQLKEKMNFPYARHICGDCLRKWGLAMINGGDRG